LHSKPNQIAHSYLYGIVIPPFFAPWDARRYRCIGSRWTGGNHRSSRLWPAVAYHGQNDIILYAHWNYKNL